MPANVPITIQNKIYSTPILDEPMPTLAAQIEQKKLDIAATNQTLAQQIADLNLLQQQFMASYCLQTGGTGFPP